MEIHNTPQDHHQVGQMVMKFLRENPDADVFVFLKASDRTIVLIHPKKDLARTLQEFHAAKLLWESIASASLPFPQVKLRFWGILAGVVLIVAALSILGRLQCAF